MSGIAGLLLERVMHRQSEDWYNEGGRTAFSG